MYGYVAAIGITLIVIGFAALAYYALANSGHQAKAKNAASGFGGVVMIGPVPIVFGSSPGMAVAAEAIAVLLIIIAIIFFFIFSKR